jgi:WD40 repeat protein
MLIGLGTLSATAAVVAAAVILLSPSDSTNARSTTPGKGSENTVQASPQVPALVSEPRENDPPVEPQGNNPRPAPPPPPTYGQAERLRAVPPLDSSVMVDVSRLQPLKVRWQWRASQRGFDPHRVAFTDDGKVLVAAAEGRHEIAVFDAVTGIAARPFEGHVATDAAKRSRYVIRGLAPLPGGEIVSIAADQDFALVWDPRTLLVRRKVPCPAIESENTFSLLQTSTDGRYLLLGGSSSSSWRPALTTPPPLVVLDLSRGVEVLSFRMDWGIATFTTDSTRLVVAHDRSGLIHVYRLDTGQLESEAKALVETEDTMPIAITPDSRYVVFMSHVSDATLRWFYLCDVATGRYHSTLPVAPPEGFRIPSCPRTDWLAVTNGSIYRQTVKVVLIDSRTWVPSAQVAVEWNGWRNGSGSDFRLQFSPDGSAFALPTDGKITVFDVPPSPSGTEGR